MCVCMLLPPPPLHYSLSPTDAKLATCSDDGTVRIFDFIRCSEEFILRGKYSERWLAPACAGREISVANLNLLMSHQKRIRTGG